MTRGRLPRLLLVVDLARCAADDAWLERATAVVETAAAEGAPPGIWLRPGNASAARARRWFEALDALRGRGAEARISSAPADRADLADLVREARARGWGLHRSAADAERGRPAGLRGALSRSAHDATEVRVAVEEGADAIVLGTVWPTASKPGRPGLGAAGLAARVADAGRVPVWAIGGVDAGRAAEARRAGARGVAVCDAVLGAADPAASVRALLAALGGER